MSRVTPPRRRKWPAYRASRPDNRSGKQAMSTTNRAFIKAYRQDTPQPNTGVVRGLSGVVRGSHDPAQAMTEGLQSHGVRRPAVDGRAGSGDPRTTVSARPRTTVAAQGAV